jgi:adenosine deaminase
VKVTLCTDNTLFSDVDAPGEYRRAAALPGLDGAAIEALAAFGHAAAFTGRA